MLTGVDFWQGRGGRGPAKPKPEPLSEKAAAVVAEVKLEWKGMSLPHFARLDDKMTPLVKTLMPRHLLAGKHLTRSKEKLCQKLLQLGVGLLQADSVPPDSNVAGTTAIVLRQMLQRKLQDSSLEALKYLNGVSADQLIKLLDEDFTAPGELANCMSA